MPNHLTCLLRNLHANQEATVRTGHGTTDWFQIGKGVLQGCILSPCLFNFYAEYVCVKLYQSCLPLCNPMDCSPQGFSVYGILQARILEWVAIPFSRGLPDPGVKARSLTLQADSLPSELPGKHHVKCWTVWITSWNHNCQEKYQQPQICRWYHPNGRKWRGTKEPLD